MIQLILFTAGIYIAGAITDPTQLCGELLAVDCKNNYIMGERDETLCGTNDMTYNNFCYYSQARCNDKTLDLKYVGACGTATVPTATAAATTMAVAMTTGTTPVPTTTLDPILEAFCGNKNNIVCGTDLSPICGSDKQFYLNKCEYSKAYCDDKSLKSKPIEFCTGGAAGK